MKKALAFTARLIIALCGLTTIALAGSGDVTIHLNGGDDVAYIGEVNTLEIWIANDTRLTGMSCPFEILLAIDVEWDMTYGNFPPVNEEGRAVNAFDLTGIMTPDLPDNTDPDTLTIAGASFVNGLQIGSSSLCYTVKFYIPPTQPYTEKALSIEPCFTPPNNIWAFVDADGTFPPDFNGAPTGSTENPVALTLYFDAVSRVCGDATCDNQVNIGDAVYIINYVFNGGPSPCANCGK